MNAVLRDIRYGARSLRKSRGLTAVAVLALTLAIAAEILGRYLFFVSVVPKHMAAPYVPVESEAA